MSERRGIRDFDDPERYEREKTTRIMPDSVVKLGIYTLRMMSPPGKSPFASDLLTCVVEIEKPDEHYHIDLAMYIKKNSDEIAVAETLFNENGFMIIQNQGERSFDDLPAEIEMGYFVGSLDPWDVEFGALVAKSRELTAVA